MKGSSSNDKIEPTTYFQWGNVLVGDTYATPA